MILLGIVLVAIVVFLIVSDLLFLKKDVTKINRLHMYKDMMMTQWSILFIICLVWLVCDFQWSELVTIQADSKNSFSSALGELQSGDERFTFLAGFITSVGMTIILMSFIMRKRAKKGVRKQPVVGNVDFLLPQTKKERLVFMFVSATAGICEEIVFRGAMAVFLLALPFGFSLSTAAIISAVIFGIAHYYQGIKGMIGTGLFGYVIFNVYVMSGSLLLPIIIHFVIDVKFVFTANGRLKEI